MTTHWKKALNKEFLGAHDLLPNEELKLTIKHVNVKEIKDPNGNPETVNVATFTDPKVKPMILNSTNCELVEKFSGSAFIEDWCKTSVQVYVKKNVRAFGELVDALRIRPQPPRMEKEVLNKDHPKWEGAVKSYREAEKKEEQLSIIRKHYALSEEDEKELIG